jgi:hypothetical protein
MALTNFPARKSPTMSYALTFVVLMAVALVAVLAAALVRRALGLDVRRKHHAVGNAVYMQVGVVFAVMLAFVFNEVLAEYEAAAQAISGECGALHGASLLAHNLPDGSGLQVEHAILDYAKAVVNNEWPAMQRGGVSVEALQTFEAIVAAATHIKPSQGSDSNIQSQILALVTQAHAFRESRIFQAGQGLPIMIWFVIVFYSLVLVSFVLFAGIESRVVHLGFTAVFATSVVLVLIVVRMLDYPFEGALTLSPHDFIKTIERVNGLIQSS